jgi:DNA-binding beta-propeller fold protein YncE
MKRSRWPSHRRSYARTVAALAAAGCAALSLVMAGGAVASGSAAAGPSSVAAGAPLASRFAALRLEPAGLGRAGHSLTERLSNVAHAGPGRRGGFVVLGGSPGAPVADTKTGTVYVPIQCTTSSCTTPEHVVDIVNAAKCNAKVLSGCRVVARATAGTSPTAAAVDPRTGTVYVTNGGSSTVSVLNGARCNARVTRSCRPVATVKVGKLPVAAVVNPATRTLYVANLAGDSVSVINVAACNARTTRGCQRPARTVRVKPGPDWVDVDTATDTVYTANSGTSGTGDTVAVINGASCNGHTGRGCSRIPAAVTVGTGAAALAIDQASNTIYVANFVNEFNGGSVSVINGARCDARITAGCGRTPPAVPTGIGTAFVSVDGAVHTVFALNSADDTMSAINTRTCRGTVTPGCRNRPPNQQATPLQGPGYNAGPSALTLTPRTSTAYVVALGGRNILSVTSIRRCSAAATAGCRAEAPAVPQGEFLLSADPATNTLYGGNLNQPEIDVINGATCHTRDLSGCAPAAEIPVPDPGADVGAIDEATHTLYAADPPSSDVFVINTATCNATHTSGCAVAPPTVKIGPFPEVPALNSATQTMYVSYGTNANKVAVVNAATCNATDTSGCGQAPAVVKVGVGTVILAVSTATDTIYGPASGVQFSGDTVAVINGARCNGTEHSGCGHLAATAKVGSGPYGAAISDRTHTLYVANNANGDSPGTVSVINTATCNGMVTSGCRGPFPTAATGNSPLLIAADTRTGIFYVTDFSSASVTVLNGSGCNAAVTSGCGKATREQAVGSAPFGLAVNPCTSTVYVANGYLPGSMSVFAATRR